MRLRIAAAFTALCFSFSPPCSAGSAYGVTEEQLQTLEGNLGALRNNNALLRSILKRQEMELTEARRLSDGQSETLGELERRLAEASTEISEGRKSLTTANEELRSAKESLARLEREKASYRRKSNFWRSLALLFIGAVGLAAVF